MQLHHAGALMERQPPAGIIDRGRLGHAGSKARVAGHTESPAGASGTV
jgi:hypothetical protein